METMRREGYEFQVSRPRVITRIGRSGERLEPYEELMIDVPEEYIGTVIEKLGPRRSELLEMKNPEQGMVRMTFRIPARGLFGYRSEFLTDTRGTGVMHHRFLDYGPGPARWPAGRTGVLVADRVGSVVAFALGEPAGAGPDVRHPGRRGVRGDGRRGEFSAGRHGRQRDQGKEAHQHADHGARTTTSCSEPPRQITLEYALEYIEEDELIEVTPKSIRLRKRALDGELTAGRPGA